MKRSLAAAASQRVMNNKIYKSISKTKKGFYAWLILILTRINEEKIYRFIIGFSDWSGVC